MMTDFCPLRLHLRLAGSRPIPLDGPICIAILDCNPLQSRGQDDPVGSSRRNLKISELLPEKPPNQMAQATQQNRGALMALRASPPALIVVDENIPHGASG